MVRRRVSILTNRGFKRCVGGLMQFHRKDERSALRICGNVQQRKRRRLGLGRYRARPRRRRRRPRRFR